MGSAGSPTVMEQFRALPVVVVTQSHNDTEMHTCTCIHVCPCEWEIRIRSVDCISVGCDWI